MQRRQSLLLALLVILLPAGEACMGYRQVPRPVADGGEHALPARTRVFTADGRIHELFRPEVMGDSIRGRALTDRSQIQRFALSEIRRVEVYHFQVQRTVAVILGFYGLMGIFGLLLIAGK